MGERIGASIQFGGKLSQAKVQDLIDLLTSEGLGEDMNDGPEPNHNNLGEPFGDWEVNYGNLDDLTAFGIENGLYYKYWYDTGPEWSAQTELYFPETETTAALLWSEGGLSMTEQQIVNLGSIDAVVAYFAQFKAPLPPLEIV
jgi:hypothetical protein